MPKQPRSIVLKSLSDLPPAPRNVKAHDLGAIISSVERFGFADAVVVDGRTGRLVSGHGRVEALLAMKRDGRPAPEGVQVKGDEWLVPVQTGWASRDDAEAEAFLVAANRLVELGGWDEANLAAVLGDLAKAGALDGTGYDGEDVDRIMAEVARAAFVPKVDPEEVPTFAPARAALGDLFALGRHRVLCGDSTSAADVERLLDGAKPHLMVTDPPYGVAYDAGWRNDAVQAGGVAPSGRAVGKVLNDDRADWSAAYRLFPGDVAYVWHSATKTHVFAVSLNAVGFDLRAQIVWAKSHIAIGRGHYHWQHEPCWYAVRDGGTGHWQGDRTQSTLWEIDKPQKSETGHSTQKPVECMARPMRNNSAPGDKVYDPFLGSGTSVIAAEELGRTCYGMELNPAYVDIIVARWEAFTGLKAQKL